MDEQERILKLARRIERLQELELEAIKMFNSLDYSAENPAHEDVRHSISRIHVNLTQLVEKFKRYELRRNATYTDPIGCITLQN